MEFYFHTNGVTDLLSTLLFDFWRECIPILVVYLICFYIDYFLSFTLETWVENTNIVILTVVNIS